MNTLLSLEPLVDQYRDDGYALVPDVLDAAKIQKIKEEVLAMAQGAYPCPGFRPLSKELSFDDAWAKILSIHQAHLVSSVFADFARDPLIVELLTKIVGIHLNDWDGRVKLVTSMFYNKPGKMAGHPWHQDERFFPTRDRSLTGVFVALETTTLENGCLWIVPRSHKNGYMYGETEHNNSEEYLYAKGCSGVDESKAIPMEMPAGSVLFFSGYLLHKSTKNRTDAFRSVIVNHYSTSWTLLPFAIDEGLPKQAMKEAIAVADNRTVLQVAGEDPYAWKGIDDSKSHFVVRRLMGSLKS